MKSDIPKWIKANRGGNFRPRGMGTGTALSNAAQFLVTHSLPSTRTKGSGFNVMPRLGISTHGDSWENEPGGEVVQSTVEGSDVNTVLAGLNEVD